jgi:hypothetical protein
MEDQNSLKIAKAGSFGRHPELSKENVHAIDKALVQLRAETNIALKLKGEVSISFTINPETGVFTSSNCSSQEMNEVVEAIRQYAQKPGNKISSSINTARAEVLGKIAKFTELKPDGTAVLLNVGSLRKYLYKSVKQAQSEHGLLPGMRTEEAVNDKTKRSVLEQRLRSYMENGCSISESALQHLLFGPVSINPFPRPIQIKPDVEHLPIHWNPTKPSKLIRNIFKLDLNGNSSTKVDKRKSESAKKRCGDLPRKQKKIRVNDNVC